MKKLWILCTLFFLPALNAQIVIQGETVYTMATKPIKQGVVVIAKGKIVAVGSAKDVKIPKGSKILKAKVVTPGLIDAHSVVGLSGILNYHQDQEQLETSAPIQPELRAIDSYNARDPLVAWLRSFGITTVHTGHAPGAIISGQTMIVKTTGDIVDTSIVTPLAMIATTLGNGALNSKGSPGTRSKVAALLRMELVRVQNILKAQQLKKEEKTKGKKEEKKEAPARNLRDEVIMRVLKREVPLLVTAHRYHDLLTALRIAKEFNIKIVLDGASEAYLIQNEIKKAGVPVIVHPAMSRTWGEKENLSMQTAAVLKKAGIPIALQSHYEGYVPKTRVVLFEAAIAAAYGLGFEATLAAITIDAARILGIAKRVGSLEVGKDADIALYNGDPFEYTSHCVGVLINGKVMAQIAR